MIGAPARRSSLARHPQAESGWPLPTPQSQRWQGEVIRVVTAWIHLPVSKTASRRSPTAGRSIVRCEIGR